MLLYSPYRTNRLTYVVGFIGKELFNEPIVTSTDKAEFLAYQGPKLNYSDQELTGEDFFIKATGLLFETGIRPIEIDCFEANFSKAFFQTSGDFPFDILATCFYLLSRYEEYLPHQPDQFGRYPHTASLAFREGFLQSPLINIWLQDFRKALLHKFPDLVLHRSNFKFVPTYDIDIAYSYLHKGFKRNAAGLIRSVSLGQWSEATQRIQVLMKQKKDPFDSYEWLDSLHLYCRTRAYYFFLLARSPHAHDKNISPYNTAMQNLIRYHASGYTVGIHPSWQSGDEQRLLREEIECLETLIEKKIEYSRQHYIRFSLPTTYRQLIQSGITKDFSMGYGSINGFRASVAASFYWYDLEREQQTQLQLFPFCFMDANSYYEQKATASQALQELMYYYRIIKKVHGLMVTIWHNQLLGDDPQFAGWKEVYEIFLREEVYWDA